MKKAIFLLLPLIMFLCGPAAAEFYKYTDSQGNTRFTDDLSNVPEDQRPGVTTYEEAESAQEPASEIKKKPKRVPQDEGNNTTTNADAKLFNKKSAELDQEYNAIMEEKSRLDEEKKEAKSTKETAKVNSKITALNDRITQWQKKRDELNAQINAHNARISQQIEEREENTESDK